MKDSILIKNDIHILIIPSWYPSKDLPTNGIFFKEQAEGLGTMSSQVGLIAPIFKTFRNLNRHNYKTEKKKIAVNNVFTISEEIWHIPFLKRFNEWRWQKTGRKLFKKYQKEKGIPDIIHVHSVISAGELAYKLFKKHGIDYVVSEHVTSFAMNTISKNDLYKYGRIFELAKIRYAVSQPFAELLSKTFNLSFVYLPNFINEFFFLPKKPNSDTIFSFLSISNLHKHKGLDILITAFAKAFSTNPSVQLQIGGSGAEKENLESIIKKLNISNQIILLGQLSREEVIHHMQNSNVFVLPSFFETFGVVLIEALAMGKPIIATKCGGPESIVTNVNGIIVSPHSIIELENALTKMYNEFAKYDTAEIRSDFMNRFSINAVAGRIINDYRNILNDK